MKYSSIGPVHASEWFSRSAGAQDLDRVFGYLRGVRAGDPKLVVALSGDETAGAGVDAEAKQMGDISARSVRYNRKRRRRGRGRGV